jgi:hypothetical protein
MKKKGGTRKYSESLKDAYNSLSSSLPDETPVGRVVTEFKEMIQSYIADAEAFRYNNDLVNEYASLTYAHGWMDAGLFLGFFRGHVPSLYLPDDSIIPGDQQRRLQEKTLRYKWMLRNALDSVEPAPETGSPYYQAALDILRMAGTICTRTENDFYPGITCTPLLGRLSYGYGWLDAGLRAGLFRILANPDLFTTETNRIS